MSYDSPSVIDRLAGVHEVAVFLGCAKQQIAALRKRPDFPAPVLHLAATPVWDLQDIESFRSGWQRRSRRAAKPIPEAVPQTLMEVFAEGSVALDFV
jgi:hypothetical protein